MIKALIYGLAGAGITYYGYNYYLQNQRKIDNAVSNAKDLKHDVKKVANDAT